MKKAIILFLSILLCFGGFGQDTLKNLPEFSLPLTNKKLVIAHNMTNIIRYKGHKIEDCGDPEYYSPTGNVTENLGDHQDCHVAQLELRRISMLEQVDGATGFALGLLQLGLGFGAFWYGVRSADAQGMVAITWLLLGYLLHTTGELCLSPVGLSMVTSLSPSRIVSTVMGAWFLSMAFSNFLAGMIAKFTGVGAEREGIQVIPPPAETVYLYGDVFGKIALIAIASAAVCLCLSPLLGRWMHTEVDTQGAG